MSYRRQRTSLSTFFPERGSTHSPTERFDDSYHDRRPRGRFQKDLYPPRGQGNRGPRPPLGNVSSYMDNSRYPAETLTDSQPQQSRPQDERMPEPVKWDNSYDAQFADQQHHLDANGDFVFNESRSLLDKAWCKIVFDPDLAKEKTKQPATYKKIDMHTIAKTSDPRLKHGFKESYKSMKKMRKKLIPIDKLSCTKFTWDKYSIGTPPTAEVIITGLGSVVSDVYLKNQLKSIGPVAELEDILDPQTGTPLGLVRVKFDGTPDKANKIARRAVEELDRTNIKGKSVRLYLNKNGRFLENIKSQIIKDRRLKQKMNEFEEKKASMPQAPKAILNAISRKQQLNLPVRIPASMENDPNISSTRFKGPPLPPISNPTTTASTTNISSPSNTTPSSLPTPKIVTHVSSDPVKQRISVPSDLDKFVKGRSFIFLSSKYLRDQLDRNDIKRALETYDWTRVLEHTIGMFVVFNSPKEAKRCFQMANGMKVYKVNLFMELQLPEGYNSTEEDDDYSNQKRDVVEEATSLLSKEFEDALQKDIRTKVIGPAVLEFLNLDNFPDLKADIESKQKAKAEEKRKTASGDVPEMKSELSLPGSVAIDVFSLNKQLPKLPSFRKKEGSIKVELTTSTKRKKIMQKKKKNLPLNYSLNFDDDAITENTDSRENSDSTPQLEDSHKELVSEPPTKKAKKAVRAMKQMEHVLFSSSSEDEDEDEDRQTKESTPTTPEDEKMEIDVPIKKLTEDEVMKDIDQDEVDEVKTEDANPDLSSFDNLHKPTRSSLPIPVYEEILPESTMNLNDLQNLVKDDEDLDLLKELYKDEVVENPIAVNLEYWAWKQKQLISCNDENTKDVLAVSEELRNSAGAHKSQGYYKIPDSVKVEYLPHRKKVHDPLSTIQVDDENDTSKVQSSRTNRSNNRRFAYEVSNFNAENEILSMNQLNKRRKPVSFARSAIHNWGLYALEPIAEREMIIEYVGERIRQQVAEFREKAYLKSGIGSSYLFRVDENTVIDATKKGGIARFINHCCVPSCTAKIIKVEGVKRIVIYALRDIAANEELTYDYKFERETNDDERVRCLCGAEGCKGYLN